MARNSLKFLGIVFDRDGSDEKFKLLKEHIRRDQEIEGWWHYLNNMYIVKTSKTTSKLTSEIHDILDDESFLIIEVNTQRSDGWLPPRAWKWFEKHAKEVVSG